MRDTAGHWVRSEERDDNFAPAAQLALEPLA
jgi:hypothetical protein